MLTVFNWYVCFAKYIAALAIPTGDIDQNLFLAFNFEAHYGLADNNTFSPTKLKLRVCINIKYQHWLREISKDFSISVWTQWEGKRDTSNGETIETHLPAKTKWKDKNMFTRKYFYRVVERHLNEWGFCSHPQNILQIYNNFPFAHRPRTGFNGTACLLKTICETAAVPLYENNGVLGNIFHIAFTWVFCHFSKNLYKKIRIVSCYRFIMYSIYRPSSSKDENISNRYYEAEHIGRENGKCDIYNRHCPKSLLELVTKTYSFKNAN